jgi:FMN-dependent NADH-azoreductase
LATVRVVRQEHSVYVKLKEVLLISADCGGHRSRDNGRPQIRGRLEALGTTSDEEFIIDRLRGERVKSETWIAPKIRTLR